MIIQDITTAAQSVGITAVVTNSDQRIESQLNRITGIEDLPIMLISWDLETQLEFNQHGFLKNPSTKVVFLLMTKAEDSTHPEMIIAAEEMGQLVQPFLVALYQILIKYQLSSEQPPITDAGYTIVPSHGAGKHSGVLGRFTLSSEVINCKDG